MSMTNAAAAALLAHYFENAAHTNIGDAPGLLASATPGVFYISLHIGDPSAGDQTTSEASYTGYARKSIIRGAANWNIVTADPATCKNAAVLTYDPCTALSDTITHFGVGSAASGAGTLEFVGTVTPNLAVSNGITPEFAINALEVNAT